MTDKERSQLVWLYTAAVHRQAKAMEERRDAREIRNLSAATGDVVRTLLAFGFPMEAIDEMFRTVMEIRTTQATA